jgi:hypothetical protein
MKKKCVNSEHGNSKNKPKTKEHCIGIKMLFNFISKYSQLLLNLNSSIIYRI